MTDGTPSQALRERLLSMADSAEGGNNTAELTALLREAAAALGEPDPGLLALAELGEMVKEGFRVVVDGDIRGWECMIERDRAFHTERAPSATEVIHRAYLSQKEGR